MQRVTSPDTRECANFLARYAKQHHAGAFATPSKKDLAADKQGLLEWRNGPERVVAVRKFLRRPTNRSDFTGQPYQLHGPAEIITHMAATPGARLPSLRRWAYVYTYLEDASVTEQMKGQGRRMKALRITPASEMIACWSDAAEPAREYGELDRATFRRLDEHCPVERLQRELAAVQEWHDDFPYYSDGTWDAVSIRGYKQDDPSWGVKPSEMPRKWLEEHPEAHGLRCGWTVLARRTPEIREWVEGLAWIEKLERVRLFRMRAKDSRDGVLGRHSDIQDRATGTRVGALARFHVPLQTAREITMATWSLSGTRVERHMEAGCMYYLDTRKPHEVHNRSGIDRINLVIDAFVTRAVQQAIMRGSELC